MVWVRSTHVDMPHQQGDWLAELESESRRAQLREHAKRVTELSEQAKQPKLAVKGKEMVEILIALNLDQESLIAALYSPVYEAQLMTEEQAAEWGGPALPELLRAIQQMQTISALQHFQRGKPDQTQIDNVRRMLLAMVTDIRAVLIKLAERICFLREVKSLDEESRVLAAKECHEIYAPLANRLGIGQLKWELEDLAFRYLHPVTYKTIAAQLLERRIDREHYIRDFVSLLQQKLNDEGVRAKVYGRPKHIYSIWRKMHKKGLSFEQVYDIRAVRIITESLKDCYAALGVVHSLWSHIGSEFDDYIATPKANGYQSIHTVVAGPEEKHVEIQIRTQGMHDDAELGVAAHWRYKEGSGTTKGTGLEDKIAWLRKLLAWQDDMADYDGLVDEIRSQVFEDRVYVFTPKGEVIDLPAGATPLDFAYYIHSQVGHRCVGAKVNGNIVPFTYHLKNGERVEILTQKNTQPSRDWLNPSNGYLNTTRARSKVVTYFKKLDREKNLKLGKELLETELAKYQVPLSQAESVLERFNMLHLDDLLAAIGAGDIRLQQVVNQLRPEAEVFAEKIERITTKAPKVLPPAGQQSDVTVEGIGNLLVQFAKCCQPVPGDAILGFVTQGRGVSVHRSDCDQLKHLLEQHPERAIDVGWSQRHRGRYKVHLRVVADDRQGLLHDITSILANEKIHVVQLDSRSDAVSQQAVVTLGALINNQDSVQRMMNRLSQLKGIDIIERIKQ